MKFVATGGRDILEVLHGVGTVEISQAEAAPPRQPEPAVLPPDESAVLEAIGDGVRHVDLVTVTTKLPASRVLAALFGLELRGIVEPLPGKQYRRA